jgi:tRNA pseudouridine55 synthase
MSAHGVLLLDKPVGPTSRDALDVVAPILNAGPLGHAGTLDPLASGLLVALIGRARKLQDYFTGKAKSYRAVVRFGAVTETLDLEAPETPTGVPVPAWSADERAALLARFLGESDQTPPQYSAVRVAGERAHAAAREGRTVEIAPRRVRIEALDLVAVDGPDWTLDVRCSAGTYVRSLARDLGVAAGTGAYLRSLRRTRSGAFDVADAVFPAAAARGRILTLDVALADEPRLDVDRAAAVRLKNGVPVDAPSPADGRTRFAWYDGAPRFRLRTLPDGRVKSDLLFDDSFLYAD